MNVYHTDGSAVPNPGKGGFAVILNGQPVVLGSEEQSTNIRMEAHALIAAIKHATTTGKPYEIHTDSEFWINVVTKWAPGWETKGWHKKIRKNYDGTLMSGEAEREPGDDIANFDLVRELYDLYCTHQPHLKWIRGHIGTQGNELADQWANRARAGEKL